MPPPQDSALQIKPTAIIRSLFAVTLAYGIHYGLVVAATLLAWGNLIEAPSAVLVPAAVVLLLISLVLAGALAGRMAGRAPGGHGLLVGATSLVVLVVGLFSPELLEPWWFRVVGAVVSLPMAYLGAELAGYRKDGLPRSGPRAAPARHPSSRHTAADQGPRSRTATPGGTAQWQS